MTEVTLVFINCTTSIIKFVGPDKRQVSMMPNMYISDTSATDSYSIIYNNKKYPIKRRHINMLEPASQYEIRITDSITVLDPVSKSFYTCVGKTADLDDKKAVILSLEQGVMLTNGTKDGEWININPTRYWLVVVIVLLFIILALSIGGFFLYKIFSN